jgi:rare lipoprotein A
MIHHEPVCVNAIAAAPAVTSRRSRWQHTVSHNMKLSWLTLGTVALMATPVCARETTTTTSVIASVYWPGDGVVKRNDFRTSSGERYNAAAMTCAHKTLALGTRIIVRYGENYAEVKVNDRGPFIKGRELDLTPGVAKSLHFPGLGHVRMQLFPPLPEPRPTNIRPTNRPDDVAEH